jgi:ADP-heptose:LPS heptosyltransferase
MSKILVIRHGALGDFVSCMGAFEAIRKHHKDDEITLLTNSPYVKLGEECGYFDAIHIDNRPKIWQLHKWITLRNWLKSESFNLVYDMQNSGRTSLYFKYLCPKKTRWSGACKGADFQLSQEVLKNDHHYTRYAKQLKIAGIKNIPNPHLNWMKSDISRFSLPGEYVVLVPGCSANAPYKRWPAESYGELSRHLLARRYKPVIIGGPDDIEACKTVAKICPHALNLCGLTSLHDLAAVSRGAKLVVGNDTGPMHITALTGIPTFFLFSGTHDPKKVIPLLNNAHYLEKNPLTELSAETVLEKIESLLSYDNVA